LLESSGHAIYCSLAALPSQDDLFSVAESGGAAGLTTSLASETGNRENREDVQND
jgi:hypothetical protein